MAQITGLSVDEPETLSKQENVPGIHELEMAISRLRGGFPKAAVEWVQQGMNIICAENNFYPPRY